MNKENCQKLFEEYIKLKEQMDKCGGSMMESGAKIGNPLTLELMQGYQRAIEDVKDCLEFLSDEQLTTVFCDENPLAKEIRIEAESILASRRTKK